MRLDLFTFAIIGAMLSGAVRETSADEFTPVQFTSVVVSNNQLVLHWTGGRPTYQLQKQSLPNGAWENLDSPTSNATAVVAMDENVAIYRVINDFTAQFRVVFDASWSQATLPTNWPGSAAHFSGLVGGTHHSQVHFWREGEPASEGIRLMAEQGQKPTLLSEIAAAIAAGHADLQLSGGGISPSPGSVSLTFPQPMRRDFPLVTLVSMIAPSPDWFVGVDSLSLIESGDWITNLVVTLYGRDAGTDSGASFTSPDQVTTPRGVITQFAGFPALQDGIIVPFGTFTFTRLD